jgi:hypothetical protein
MPSALQDVTTAPEVELEHRAAPAFVPVLLLALILVVVGWYRTTQVPTIPHGLYDDEASIGYNAFHIQRDGVDETGERMPLYFRSWGDYKSPLFVYSVAGVFRVLGISDRSLRLTSVLWSMLFVIGVWLLARRLAPQSVAVAAFATLAAGLLPWTFVLSRIAFEVNSWLPTIGLAFVFVWDTFHGPANDSRRRRSAALAGILFAVSFYGYSTARLLSPLLVVVIGLIYIRRASWREGVLLAAPMVVSVLATMVYDARHPGAVAARFRYLTYLFDPGLAWITKLKMGIKFYLRHFSPEFLLISGDPNHRHSTGHGGELYVVVAVLAVIGVAAWFVRRDRRDDRFHRLVLVGTLLSPVAAALTRESIPHAIRSVLLCFFVILLSCYGLTFLAARLAPLPRGLLWVVVFGALAIESQVFLVDYFVRYGPASGVYFEYYGAREALQGAARRSTPVVFSSHVPPEILHWYQASLPDVARLPVAIDDPVARPDACILYLRRTDARVLDQARLPYEERGLPGAPVALRCFGIGSGPRGTP